ncbi:MAG: hypothetical protein FJZ00_11530, partial [Candidatus Sericytochromatia bacterium]|nr:hypothetical protein [Candidatus Tanganyikabacteria bacterium]
MLEGLRQSFDDLIARFRPATPTPEPDNGHSGHVAGSALVDEAAIGSPEPDPGAGDGAPHPETSLQRRGTGYLPPLPGESGRPVPHPTSDLQSADVSPTQNEKKLGKVMAPESVGPLTEMLATLGPRAFPFKGLILGRLTALPTMVAKLRESAAARDHARTAAAALAVQDACATLADDLVHQAATVTKLASGFEKAVKARDKAAARAHADELHERMREFDAAIEAKRQAAFSAGEKLARFAVAKNYSGVAEVAPALARDAAIIAFLTTREYPAYSAEVDLAGSLTDRTLRLQQALISRSWATASRLGREMSVQAAIMADPTVKLAVQLIVNARKVRDVTSRVGTAAPEAKNRLAEITARLTQAVPALTNRLDLRLAEVDAQADDLAQALANKDYPAAAGLAT